MHTTFSQILQRKYSLLILLLANASLGVIMSPFALLAQSTRLPLYEVFSGENCPPCAPTNVYLHGLALQNPTKVLMIKYQVNIPSAGPIYNQNPTDPSTRRTYYNVTSAPNARFDGSTIGSGHGQNLTQSLIDSRFSVPSRFSINLQHGLNTNADSINISIIITANQAINNGTFIVRVAMIEKQMSFPTPPGSNGETEFYNVVRKMIPSANGLSIPTSWAANQSDTINLSAAVPPYIRDLTELGVVAFVQENTSKEIEQSAISEPLAVPTYAQAIFNDSTFYRCTASFNPILTVENIGLLSLNSLKIRQIFGTANQVTPWTGNLVSGQTANINLAPVSLVPGLTNYTLKIDSMNGLAHPSVSLSTINGKTYYSASTVNQINNVFSASTFPPANFAINNGTPGTTNGWSLASQGANSTIRSAKMNFYDAPTGDVNDMYLPRLDLSNMPNNPSLKFYYAHAPYLYSTGQTTSDQLDVEISTDCGLTWTTLFSKSGLDLATVAATSTSFVPSSAANWIQENLSLSAFSGQTSVLIRFRAISDFGNNLYIDEINVPTLSASNMEDAQLRPSIVLYPNPTVDQVTLLISNNDDTKAIVSIRNTLGELVFYGNYSVNSENCHIPINTSNLSEGFYTLELLNGDMKACTRFTRLKN